MLVSWPQSETRMTVCSEKLHGLVVEQRLRHPGPAAGQAARLDLKSAAAGVGAAVALDRDGCGAAALAAP